ncbi:MAG: glycosyltransferase [Ruminococcaceae bacterium]|nr:glycosyltransferase [Oscillospiraceae bacterium]
MNNKKLLTVTVPCYNSEGYMRKCVDSLLVGGERVEIIIINDGSKDGTGAIADEYAAKYPEIVRVVHQENGGHGEGINQGLKRATGIYFKVVDSDDVLDENLPLMLDKLEECEAQGGVDLLVTNYFYAHEDEIGDQSICYKNALPENRIFTWEETRRFRLRQMLTIHSCTFRTEIMRKSGKELPKHTFYEDNYMICLSLPHVERMYYLNKDLYRYTIGREGQSVQRDIIKKRYKHQLLSTVLSFQSCHIDDLKSRKKRRYMKHELFMMLGISTFVTRANKTKETDADLKQMWEDCKAFDKKYGNYFRWRTPLFFANIPGAFGRWLTGVFYAISNKIVRYY